MTHQDPLDELRQALAVAPSPEFAARVRRQVATQHTRVAWWSVRHLAVAAAAVGVVSVAVARWSVPVVPAVLVGPGAAASPSSPMTHGAATGAAGATAARPRTTPIPVAATVDVFAETLVPDDQRIALERLLGAIRAGRATVPAVVADEIVDDDGRRLPRALLIEPLKLELLAGTPAEPNKDPIKDSIK